jgi:hypothetical protein
MAIEGKAKTVMYEIIGAFVVILLLVVLRPLFIGQVAGASEPYTVTWTNATGTETSVITPSTTLSVTTADTLYTVAIFLVVLVSLIVISLSMFGKL